MVKNTHILNKITRNNYPETLAKRFNIKKRQRLISRFLPYQSYRQIGLSAISNLKKDLPFNMHDEHKHSDRVTLFFTENEDTILEKLKEPFYRTYFNYDFEQQIPYRLGYEFNENMTYDSYQRSFKHQKKFNHLIMQMGCFYSGDHPLLEITQPESFVGHFDAVVHTQRTLKNRACQMHHLFETQRRRFKYLDIAWLHVPLLRTAFQLWGYNNSLSLNIKPNQVWFSNYNRFNHNRNNRISFFSNFFIVRELMFRRRKRPWRPTINRFRLPVNRYELQARTPWRQINNPNYKPHLFRAKRYEDRVRFQTYQELLHYSRPGLKILNRQNLRCYHKFMRFSQRTLPNLDKIGENELNFLLPKKGSIGFAKPRMVYLTMKSSTAFRFENPYLEDIASNSAIWATTIWNLSTNAVMFGIRIALATIGLKKVEQFRKNITTNLQILTKLKIIVSKLFLTEPKGHPLLYSSDWKETALIDEPMEEWLSYNSSPYNRVIKQFAKHKWRNVAMLEEELEMKDKSIKFKVAHFGKWLPKKDRLFFKVSSARGFNSYRLLLDFLFPIINEYDPMSFQSPAVRSHNFFIHHYPILSNQGLIHLARPKSWFFVRHPYKRFAAFDGNGVVYKNRSKMPYYLNKSYQKIVFPLQPFSLYKWDFTHHYVKFKKQKFILRNLLRGSEVIEPFIIW
jgi:hypothetical protein